MQIGVLCRQISNGLGDGGVLWVQSLPRQIRTCTLPALSRACIRYPSSLISCNQTGPPAVASTSLLSCGLTHLSRPGEWLPNVLFIDFAIKEALQKPAASDHDRICTGPDWCAWVGG
jgi:hypothetical protein